MSGRVWQGSDLGPGRDMRTPQPRRPVLDPNTHPGSDALDRVLAGEQPGSTYLDTPDTIVPGQIYDRGRARDVRRGGTAQLVPVPVHADHGKHPVRPPGTEVGWERNPPHQPGLEVVRDHGGAQAVPIRVDRGPADYLGSQYFHDGEPSPAPEPVCAYCHQPFESAKHSGGGTDNKKYCSAAHRARASEQRKRQAAQPS
jgi:hypothetical protein